MEINLGFELRMVLRKHIRENSWLPDALKPLAEEMTLPLIRHILCILGNFELGNRRTLSHPEIWDVNKKKKI